MLTISEMMKRPTFEERLDYLTLEARSSQMTFENLREINQSFYNSALWKQIRRKVIARDFGYDLAVPGMEIFGKVMVHHMNPLKPKDLLYISEIATNPEFLVTVSESTHNAIHYQSEILPSVIIEREPGDTTLWR
jgi:hypothetical protein